MKSNYTDITIVLDRSGSMETIANDTIGGFNRFIEDQKKVSGTATLTLRQFDDCHDVVIDAKDIQQTPALHRGTFVPRGMTALLDAIGMGIKATGERLGSMPEHDRPEKVVFVIITDGAENASREYTLARVNDMIKLQRETYKWEFVFLGANIDAVTVATSMGIAVANSIQYAANSKGTTAVFASASANLCSYRASASRSMAFTSDDHQKQAAAVTP